MRGMGEITPEYLILPQVLGKCKSDEAKKPVMGLPGVVVVRLSIVTARGSLILVGEVSCAVQGSQIIK